MLASAEADSVPVQPVRSENYCASLFDHGACSLLDGNHPDNNLIVNSPRQADLKQKEKVAGLNPVVHDCWRSRFRGDQMNVVAEIPFRLQEDGRAGDSVAMLNAHVGSRRDSYSDFPSTYLVRSPPSFDLLSGPRVYVMDGLPPMRMGDLEPTPLR